MSVRVEREGAVTTVILQRTERRNAVDRETAEALSVAFDRFEKDEEQRVAVLYGAGGVFCSGADLKAVADGKPNRLEPDGDGPMGVSRKVLSKPVIAAIEGYAVAGGLELALWCDLRVGDETAVLGVLCRRWGVPLIDGGTVRLPRVVGLGRALDLILTGREVGAREALSMGLLNLVVAAGTARAEAEALARSIAKFPQRCLRADRESTYGALEKTLNEALGDEFARGVKVINEESVEGARRFASGAGRHGGFET